MSWLDEHLTGDPIFDDALRKLSSCPTPGTVKAILHAFQWQRDMALAEDLSAMGLVQAAGFVAGGIRSYEATHG